MPALTTKAMSRAAESPFLDRELFVGTSEEEWEPRAATLAGGSPFLHDVEDGRLFEAFVPKVSQADLRTRIDEYFNRANVEYTIPKRTLPDGTEVAESKAEARPQFRYARRDSEAVKSAAITRVSHLVGRSLSAQHRKAIGTAVYGRAKPSEIAGITQVLIDKGELDAVRADNPGASSNFLIRALQRKFKIGIDCAGYVQLAFIFAYTGSDDDPSSLRERLGLHPRRTYEALRRLSATHFTKVPIVDARTGDLFVLKPQETSDDQAWHTVIIVERTVSGTVHTFVVHASWGVDLYGLASGGVRKRRWQHDTSTGKWWDIAPVDRTVCGEDVKKGDKACVNTIGPYNAHRPYGVYRPKEKT